MPAKIE